MRWVMVGDIVADTTLESSAVRAAATRITGGADWGIVGNLELPLCDEGVGERARKLVAWHAPEATAPLLADSGIHAVSMANNHGTDWGMQGLLATVDALERAGVGGVGAGSSVDSASAAWVSPDGGLAVCGLACTVPPGSAADTILPGMAALRISTRMDVDTYRLEELPLTPPRMSGRFDVGQIRPLLDTIRAQTEAGRTVAVLVHWGVAFDTRVDDYMFDLAETLIDAGARLIIGHHSHTVGPVGRYRDALVCFATGDFVRLPTLVAGADAERPGLAQDWENWSRVGLGVCWDEGESVAAAEVVPFAIDLPTGLPLAPLAGEEAATLNSWLNWVSTLNLKNRPGWKPIELTPTLPFPLRYA